MCVFSMLFCCVCMYVMYVAQSVYMFARPYVLCRYAFRSLCVYIRIIVCMHVCVDGRPSLPVYAHMDVCVYVTDRVCIDVCVRGHICLYVCVCMHFRLLCVYVCLYVCLHWCVDAYACVYVCIHLCMWAR